MKLTDAFPVMQKDRISLTTKERVDVSAYTFVPFPTRVAALSVIDVTMPDATSEMWVRPLVDTIFGPRFLKHSNFGMATRMLQTGQASSHSYPVKVACKVGSQVRAKGSSCPH